MDQARSSDPPANRGHLPSIGKTSSNSLTWCPHQQCTIHNKTPILWDQDGRPSLLGIRRGHPLIGLLKPLDSPTTIQTAKAPQQHCQRSSRFHLPVLRHLAHPLMRGLELLSPKTGTSPSIGPVHSFQPLVPVRYSSTVGDPSLP